MAVALAVLAAARAGAQRASRQLDGETVRLLGAAVEEFRREDYAAAKTLLAKLDRKDLSAFAQNRLEQILFPVAWHEKRYEEAAEHLERAIEAAA